MDHASKRSATLPGIHDPALFPAPLDVLRRVDDRLECPTARLRNLAGKRLLIRQVLVRVTPVEARWKEVATSTQHS